MAPGATFRFNTKFDQTILLGKKASNVAELCHGVRTVPDASIYFHTHRFLQQHHYLSPEPPNDFAYWTTHVLNEETLGEQLSSVDIIQFHSITALRQRIGDLIDGYLQSAYRSVDAPEGQEFYFMSTQTFVLATRYEARDLAEFAEALRDFILAVGDDHDDEELFGVLPPQPTPSASAPPTPGRATTCASPRKWSSYSKP